MPSTSDLTSITGQLMPSMSSEASESPRAGSGIEPLVLLKRHSRLALVVFVVLAVLGGLFLQHHMKPMYAASSVVYVSPTFPSELAGDREHERRYDDFVEQQEKSVTRYETLKQVLEQNPGWWRYPGESEQTAIERLQAQLKVSQVGHSYEVAIELDSPHSEHLAELVNAITKSFLEATRKDEVYGRDERVATLTTERDTLQKQLDGQLQAQDKLMADVGMVHFGGSENPYDAHLTLLRQQLADAHEKSAEADAEWNSLHAGNKDTGSAASNPALEEAANREVNGDAGVAAMKSQLQTRRGVLMMQISGLTPNNPVYVQAQAELKDIDQQMTQLTAEATAKSEQRIRQRMLNSRAQANNLETQLAGDIASTRAQATTAAPKLQEAQMLAARIDRTQRDIAELEGRVQTLTLEGESPGSVHLYSAALPPTGPMQNKKMIYFGGLLLLSLFAGAAATLLAEAVDPNVYTSSDVKRVVGFPPIGVLLSPMDFTPEVQKEYFLRLASGLDQAYRRGGARTFIFPSMGRKSTRDLVRDVGAELSANGLHVLVVNVLAPNEVPEPDAPRADLLALTTGATDLTTEFNDEPFRVVSLAPADIADVLRRSRTYYNTILVAADPLFTSAHTEHFARIADGTVLIVDSGRTRKEELARAARLLERLKIKGIAIVLTGVTEKRADEDVARTLEEYKWKTA